jgi:hypothetical protein
MMFHQAIRGGLTPEGRGPGWAYVGGVAPGDPDATRAINAIAIRHAIGHRHASAARPEPRS